MQNTQLYLVVSEQTIEFHIGSSFSCKRQTSIMFMMSGALPNVKLRALIK